MNTVFLWAGHLFPYIVEMPDYPEASADIAPQQVKANQEQFRDAAKTYKQAIILNPDFVLAHLGLAEVAVQIDEQDTALVSLKQAVRLEPGNPDPLWLLAELYDENFGMSEKGLDLYRNFARRFPGDPGFCRGPFLHF